jgi:hypothetical protein
LDRETEQNVCFSQERGTILTCLDTEVPDLAITREWDGTIEHLGVTLQQERNKLLSDQNESFKTLTQELKRCVSLLSDYSKLTQETEEELPSQEPIACRSPLNANLPIRMVKETILTAE